LGEQFEVVAGTAGLDLGGVVHALVPGRGRNASGFGLSASGLDRVVTAHQLF